MCPCCPYNYYDMIKNKNQVFNYRLKMVLYANPHGKKSAARFFHTTVSTVRKWLKRFLNYGKEGLFDESRRPHNSPNKLKQNKRDKIIKLRKQTHFGAQRLKMEFELPYSNRTIHKIIKQPDLVKQKIRKHHKKHDLRRIKNTIKPLTLFEMDVKYLNDIPNFYTFMINYKLPKYQYTIREIRSGAMFLAFASECNVTNSIIFVSTFLII